MENPTVEIDWMPFNASYSEMEDILSTVLSSGGFGNFHHNDTPKHLSATKTDKMFIVGRSFQKDYALEIRWRRDKNPPHEFEALKVSEPLLDPLLIKIQFRDPDNNVENATSQLENLWQKIIEEVQETIEALKTKEPPTDHGTAQWATIDDLKAEGYVHEDSKENPNTRLLLGDVSGKLISVPTRQTEAHTIIQGPPGSGKSRTLIIPQLIERVGSSAIVTEVTAAEHLTPVVYGHTAGYRKSQGQVIHYINPSDLKNSTRFNPIDFIKSVEDAIYYADLIITNTTMGTHVGDQIWTQSEKHLLTALLLYAWGLADKKKSVVGGKSNLGYIRSLLRVGPIALNAQIASDGIPDAKYAFDEFIRNSSPNFRLGVFSGLIQRLNPWLNPNVAALTEVTDFDQEELRNNLFTFYLAYPVNRRDFRPIMSIALNFLMQLPCRKDFVYNRPLTFLLDELAAFGRIPGIDDIQATIRNNKIGMVFCFQDLQQLTKVYSQPEADVLFTNSATKIIFSTGSPRAQKHVSDMLGQTTKVKKTVSSSGHINKTTFGAPLLSPAEIGKIPDKHVLVIRDKRSPVMIETCDPGRYSDYAKNYPPPIGKDKPISETVYQTASQTELPPIIEPAGTNQIKAYNDILKAKLSAEKNLEAAIKSGAAPHQIQKVQKDLDAAIAAYEDFVSAMDEDEEEELPTANPINPQMSSSAAMPVEKTGAPKKPIPEGEKTPSKKTKAELLQEMIEAKKKTDGNSGRQP